MVNLGKLEAVVKELLEVDPKTRASDDLLYLGVLMKVHPHWNNAHINTDIQNVSIGEFFTERKNAGLPNFESVSRCRRKLQEKYKQLKPAEVVIQKRKELEKKFFEYAKQGELF